MTRALLLLMPLLALGCDQKGTEDVPSAECSSELDADGDGIDDCAEAVEGT